MTRVIGYARVSTDEQASGGVSLEDQQRRIALYCELHGLELVGVEVDGGFSGKDLDRPGAQAVLAAIRERRVGGVVITKLDRWTRKVRDLCDLLDLVEKRRAALMSIGETLDTSTATGRMVMQIVAAVAEMERNAAVERTTAALNHKRSKGEKLGGKVPYGYSVEERDGGKYLVENPDEQEIIRGIRTLRENGCSLDTIAASLNTEGFTTREGGPWRRQYVHRILKGGAR